MLGNFLGIATACWLQLPLWGDSVGVFLCQSLDVHYPTYILSDSLESPEKSLISCWRRYVQLLAIMVAGDGGSIYTFISSVFVVTVPQPPATSSISQSRDLCFNLPESRPPAGCLRRWREDLGVGYFLKWPFNQLCCF